MSVEWLTGKNSVLDQEKSAFYALVFTNLPRPLCARQCPVVAEIFVTHRCLRVHKQNSVSVSKQISLLQKLNSDNNTPLLAEIQDMVICIALHFLAHSFGSTMRSIYPPNYIYRFHKLAPCIPSNKTISLLSTKRLQALLYAATLHAALNCWPMAVLMELVEDYSNDSTWFSFVSVAMSMSRLVKSFNCCEI